MTQNEDSAELCTFFRRSRYDMIQVREPHGWGRAWTFAPCDVHAAERVGRQLRRVYGMEVQIRHARKARLKAAQGRHIEAVIMTELPGLHQVALSLETGQPFYIGWLVMDEPMKALIQTMGFNRDARIEMNGPE